MVDNQKGTELMELRFSITNPAQARLAAEFLMKWPGSDSDVTTISTQPETSEPAAPKKVGRGKSARPAISETPEDRRPPEEDPETQAQDEADEKAESEANVKPTLTHDDVRVKLRKYLERYGEAAGMEDGPKLLSKVIGRAENDLTKVSDLPGDQDTLQRAIDGVQEMIDKNPYKRAVDL